MVLSVLKKILSSLPKGSPTHTHALYFRVSCLHRAMEWRVSVWDPVAHRLSSDPALSHTSCETKGKLFNLSVPRFPSGLIIRAPIHSFGVEIERLT